MPKIIFVDSEGTEREVEAAVGTTIMEAAVSNEIPGIDADCGGACACATCHGFIDTKFISLVGPAGDVEASMLEFADDVADNSRLCCQITVTESLDGLRVTTPESQ